MRIPNTFLLGLGSLLVLETTLAVPANLKENYQAIIDRNPFGLKPPPPPPTNNVAPPVDKPKIDIFMTGIVSVGYPKWPKKVFLKTQEQNKKEPKFLDLREGDESDGIRILSIDEVNKQVKIRTDSGETLLTFKTHGIAPPATAPVTVPGQPGVVPLPGQPGAVPPQPGGAQAANNVNQFAPNQPAGANPLNNPRSIPSRQIRSRIPGANSNPGIANPGSSTAVPQVPQEQQQPVDSAEQYLRMHLDKVQKEQQGIPMPPIPPIE